MALLDERGGEPLAYSPKGQIAVAELRALVGRYDA